MSRTGSADLRQQDRTASPRPPSGWWGVAERVREHAVLVVSTAFVLGVAWGVWHFVRLSGTLAQELALQDAARYAQAVAQFPTLYGAPARRSPAAPADASTLAAGPHGAAVGSWIRLYGKQPLPWRRDGVPKDEFERQALAQLDVHPEAPFHRFEQLDGRPVLRYATPSVMRYSTADVIQPSCLACHNSHPDPLANAGTAPDGRGVLEVVIPLEDAIARTRGGLSGTFALMAGLALLAALALGVLGRVIGKLKRASAEALELAAKQKRINQLLEEEVAERVRAEAEASRARDQALEASRLKSQFVTNISDGIRTPMNGMVGAVELLLEGDLSPAQQEYARIAQSSSAALLAIVNDILDFSHIVYGDFALEAVDFGLRAVVGEVLDATRAQAHAKLLELSCEIAPAVPDALVGDPARVLQILLNLVDNAIRCTAEGEVVVRIGVESASEADVLLHVEVADTGAGIAPEMHEAIFDAFTQADVSPARRRGGMGLGLSLCAQLVRKMGGRIWVDSARGQGSRFHFTAAFPRGQAVVAQAPLAPPAVLQGMAVLVVDADPATCRVLAGHLEGWGACPASAGNAAEALFALRRAQEDGHPVPLALVRGRILGTGPGSLLERIRADRRIADVRVVAFGSTPAAGAHAWLTMPVKGVDLLHAVRVALQIDTVGPAPAAARREKAPREQVAPAAGLPRVLVAEDNVTNRDLMVLWLKPRGYAVVAVNDGLEAVAQHAEAPCDLIIMDVQMPVMDGIAATAAIRTREREHGGHVPIIAVTALARDSDRARCFEAGMDAFVTKPVRLAELLGTIEGLLPKPAARADAGSAGGAADEAAAELGEARGFAEESRTLLARMRECCERCDTGTLAEAGHQLREALRRAGVAPVAAVAEELERQAAAGDVEGTRRTLALLEDALRRLDPASA